ncbi:MAG: hypothetical protein AAFU61_04420, partial [Pseudomonadota bacterium]
MATLRIGGSGADLVALSAAFARQAGSGELRFDTEGPVYEWNSDAGETWRAEGGALRIEGGGPVGPTERLSLLTGDLVLDGEGDPLGDLAVLAAQEAGPADPFAAGLTGADRLLVQATEDVRLFGDAFEGQDRAEGGDDLYRDDRAPGARRVSGDFWSVSALALTAEGGDDRFQALGTEALTLWGDAALLPDRAANGGTLIGGADRLDASGARATFREETRALIGDAGMAGRNWRVDGGDDVILGPPGPAALIGDVTAVRPGARVVAGADTVQGGDGDDAIYGDVVRLEAGARLSPGGDVLRGGRGDDVIWGDVEQALGRVEAPQRAADRLWGGDGRDMIRAGWGDDRAWGGDGADDLRGGVGDDRLTGGGGRDRLRGDGGRDRLDGGA